MQENSGITINYPLMGTKIRAARKEKKMTQGQVAEICGISAAFFGHIERGTRIASVETLVAIAKALQVSLDSLIWDAVQMPETENEFDMLSLRSETVAYEPDPKEPLDQKNADETEYCYLRIGKTHIEALRQLFRAMNEKRLEL